MAPHDDSDEYPAVDRRRTRRRTDDVKEHDIVETVAAELPLIQRILRTGKIAGAVFAIGTFIGSTTAFISLRVLRGEDIENVRREAMRSDTLLSRRIDSNTVRITAVQMGQGEIIAQNQRMASQIELQSYALCIVIRRVAPDARPNGCDSIERKGGPQP